MDFFGRDARHPLRPGKVTLYDFIIDPPIPTSDIRMSNRNPRNGMNRRHNRSIAIGPPPHQVLVGLMALTRTQSLVSAGFILSLYPLSLVLVWALQDVLGFD